MAKRLVDLILGGAGLLITSFVWVPCAGLIWLQDRHSPFYVAPRVGRNGTTFRMVKLRSMVVDADRVGVDSTSKDDLRITRFGAFVRAYKLDELLQLWNVVRGEMSLVGPRPQVQWAVDRYGERERGILTCRPGVTDFASIVFADEGEVLADSTDPDADYLRLIHPWKTRLALFYVDQRSTRVDLALIGLTAVALVSRPVALAGVARLLTRLGADRDLVAVARRREGLEPLPKVPG